jgi:DNA-binding MarR family transcriptional regulator
MAMVMGVDVADLAVRLRIVNGRLHRRLRQRVEEGLGASQLSALATVVRQGPMGPSELADAEHVSRPSMTSIVQGLEDAGLVARGPDPTDGRRVVVTATGNGRRLIERMRRRKAAYLAQRLRELPEEDIATVDDAVAILQRLLERSA